VTQRANRLPEPRQVDTPAKSLGRHENRDLRAPAHGRFSAPGGALSAQRRREPFAVRPFEPAFRMPRSAIRIRSALRTPNSELREPPYHGRSYNGGVDASACVCSLRPDRSPCSRRPRRGAGQPLRIIAFGAHPDDCDIRAGGTAAKWAALGHKVRFVSVTNGDAGHHEQGGGQLAMRRRAERRKPAAASASSTSSSSWIADNMYLVDVTIAVDHLTLAARNEGLGTCWIGAFNREALKTLSRSPMTMIRRSDAAGFFPSGMRPFQGGLSRKPLGEIACSESFGQAFKSDCGFETAVAK